MELAIGRHLLSPLSGLGDCFAIGPGAHAPGYMLSPLTGLIEKQCWKA